MTGSLAEFVTAARAWRQWSQMALTEIGMQYRRSILGPFWLSLHSLLFISALGIVYSLLFNMSASNFVPYFATGLLAWNFLSSFVNEGANTFTAHSVILRNLNLPLPFFAYKVASKQAIVFLHNLFVLVPVFLIFPDNISVTCLLSFPAIIIYIINGVALCVLLGILCSRFRDLSNMVSSIMNVLFFITPVFWPASTIRNSKIVEFNILHHYIEIFRAPLLGMVPTTFSITMVAGFTLFLWLVTIIVFVRYRWRVVHAV